MVDTVLISWFQHDGVVLQAALERICERWYISVYCVCKSMLGKYQELRTKKKKIKIKTEKHRSVFKSLHGIYTELGVSSCYFHLRVPLSISKGGCKSFTPGVGTWMRKSRSWVCRRGGWKNPLSAGQLAVEHMLCQVTGTKYKAPLLQCIFWETVSVCSSWERGPVDLVFWSLSVSSPRQRNLSLVAVLKDCWAVPICFVGFIKMHFGAVWFFQALTLKFSRFWLFFFFPPNSLLSGRFVCPATCRTRCFNVLVQ